MILCALFGTSLALAAGPVAVASLLAGSAIGQVAELTLAFLSGDFLVLMRVFAAVFYATH